MIAQAQTSAYGFGLAQVLGLSINQVVGASERLSSHDDEQLDERASLAEALQTRPDLQPAMELEKAAAFDRKSARAERLPEIHFDGFWAESGRSPSHGLPVYSYQVEIRLPIFTGGRISAEIKRSGFAEQKATENVADRRNVVVQEVRTALTSFQAARSELQLSTQAVDLSTREVKQSRERSAAGVTNNIEVITARTL